MNAEDGTPVRLSPSAYYLLAAVESGVGYGVLAEGLSRRQGRTVSAGEIESAYHGLAERLERASRPRPSSSFRFRFSLLPESVVSRIAGRLAVLFRPRWALGLLVASVASAAFLLPGWNIQLVESGSFYAGYGLFLISLLAHELGHASASARFRARPSDIGVVLYLIFPALFSDVTRAWKLGRWQRVVVDLGGIYFQLVAGAVYVLIGWATDWTAFQAAAVMIVLSCLVSLNPLLRFDGYWALADALGVTRLDREPGRLLRHLAGRFRRQSGKHSWPWPAGITAALTAYSALVLCGWSYLLYRLVPDLWHRASDYPAQVVSVLQGIADAGLPQGGMLTGLAVSTLVLVLASLMTRQVIRRAASLVGCVVRAG
jgi:putative peptide zinc metalloprotease protein